MTIASKPLKLLLFIQNLRLAQKLTVLLVMTFAVGTICSAILVNFMVDRTVREEISTKALLLMETMNSVRDYTDNKIKPQLKERMEQEFLPESLPAFSARTVFEILRKNPEYQEFLYRENALNPTSLEHRADRFETEVVNRFRSDSNLKEQTGFRTDTGIAKGQVFYISRPIAIKKQSCLQCHGKPQDAPKTMIAKYGNKHGFGWKLNEIVGTQTIFVPVDRILNNAKQLFISFMTIILAIFGMTIALVNIWIQKQVVKPVTTMAHIVEAISMGDLDARLDGNRQDEIGLLAQSIARLKISLQMAMNRIKTPTH
jgi:HAMP domain-containing protein